MGREVVLSPKFSLDALPEVLVSRPEIARGVSQAFKQGKLRHLGHRVYTRNLDDPLEPIVARHLWQLMSELVPGALIADRTALEFKPAKDGSIFVVSERKRDLELPGVVIRSRSGPPPVVGSDVPFIGSLFMSSGARACLDNLAPSRQRNLRVSRTVHRTELETWLEAKIRSHGHEALNRSRDEARRIAAALGREDECRELERIIAGLLGTHESPLQSRIGRARQVGRPYDPERLRLFEILYQELRARAPVTRPARDDGVEGRTTLAFFEAYFSNFIEGTEFTVPEARRIVFDNVIPANRPADAHDVAGTWRVVSDPIEMARTPVNPAQLLALLKQRQAALMTARPEKRPGLFKVEANQAGSTMFVAPELVESTLIHGFDLYRGLDTAFARAVYLKFLISEVHPFDDGNGRTARIMMNAELIAAGEGRIIIPTVLRDNYISALKALSHGGHPRPLVELLEYAQRWVAAIPWGSLDETTAVLTSCHAFLDSAEAERKGVRLRIPDPWAR